MIYYAASHDDGAASVAFNYNLRGVDYSSYISGYTLLGVLGISNIFELIDAAGQHPTIHAYVTNDLTIYFHPDPLISIMRDTYTSFFNKLI